MVATVLVALCLVPAYMLPGADVEAKRADDAAAAAALVH